MVLITALLITYRRNVCQKAPKSVPITSKISSCTLRINSKILNAVQVYQKMYTMQCETRICITVLLEGITKFREDEFGLVVYIVQSYAH